ncbi:MAG: glycosyltransferase family 39 protein [Candidatus Omnitrophica bacterium]|jgi:hypothetical protein|nr:glycosyltransferase family 39 protein [Candidatus Omnitrophota bacterium]
MRAGYAAGLLIFAAILSGIVLRYSNIDNAGRRSPDELAYTWQANHIIGEKIAGTRSLVQIYNNDKKLWVLPNPTRIGYLWPLSYFMEATGFFDYRAGSYFSTIFSVVSILLITAFALRYLNKWVALYAVLALGVSPMELAVSMRAWADAFCGCLGLLLVFLTVSCIKNEGKLTKVFPFVLTGTYYFMVKEAGVLLYLLCGFWLLSSLAARKMFGRMVSTLLLMTAASAAGICFMAYSLGGIGSMFEVIRHISEAMPFNQYAVSYQSGPWYNIIYGLFILSPLNVLLCAAGMAGFAADLLKGNRGPEGVDRWVAGGLMAILTAYVIVMTWAPYCQNVRYLSPVYGIFYLVSGIGAWYVYLYLKTRFKAADLKVMVCLMVAVAVFSAMSDYGYFRKALHKMKIVDITLKALESRPRF